MPDDTFRPPVRDYHTKHERDDHAPNQALHDALKAAFDTAEDGDTVTVNLMGSHAPGEKPNGPAPTYEVWVESRNDGAGHPIIPKPVRRMVDRNDAKITGVVECSDDHLVVSLRPIETRVEPVEVETRFIPDRFVDVDDVEHDAAVVLRKVVDEHGPESDRANEAARALSTVVYTANPDRYADHVSEPDAAPQAAYRELWRRAGVDPDSREMGSIRPTVDGHEFAGPVDERTRDAVTHTNIDDVADAVDAARNLLHTGPTVDFPKTRPPVEPIREWVEDNRHVFLADKGDPEDVANTIADAIENFVVYGDVDPDLPDDGASQEDVEDVVDDMGADE